MKKALLLALSAVFAALVFGAGCDKSSETDSVPAWNPIVDPSQFVPGVNHPYFSVVPGRVMIYAGQDGSIRDSVEVRDTDQTRVVMGVTCMVSEFRGWENGELVEIARDWYAQDQSGTVWYFGEEVENYENGVLVDTDGSWEAGVDGALPGYQMKANPQVGDTYHNEFYEEEAEDQSEVLSVTAAIPLAYGDFVNCVKTADWTDLEPGITEHKYYAPGIGLVYEIKVEGGSGRIELVEIRQESGGQWNPSINPGNFVSGINNPYYPVIPGRVLVYTGDGDSIEVHDTGETRTVMGVTCMVSVFREWSDGELIEVAYDWFAQDQDGNVWYFGEAVENYDNGVLIDTNGSWEAGVDGALPGYQMKAHPFVGDGYYQEYYEGEAEDQARIISTTAATSVEYGQFNSCVKSLEWTDFEPGVAEYKYFASGVGLILEQDTASGSGGVELVDVRFE